MVSLLELMWKDGNWSQSAYVSLDWDASPTGYSKEDLSGPENRVLAGRWYCRPPAMAGYIARTQSGLFVLDWFSENPQSQFFRKTHYAIQCYNYNTVSKDYIAFTIDEAPNPMNWSPKTGSAFIWNANNPMLRWKSDAVTWEKLRP